MNRVLNQMTHRAQLADKKVVCTYGIVYSYDPDNYCCKVMLQPANMESGWLPILSPFIGNEWGIFAPPSQGDMVVVLHIEGSLDVGAVVGGQFNNNKRPVKCESGSLYMIHKSGSALKFNNDGTVNLIADGKLNIQAEEVDIACDVKVTGNISATGDVSDGTSTMQTIRSKFNAHKHTSAASGSPTSPPTQGM